MKIPFESFDIRLCTPEDIDSILSLQDETFETLPSEEYLRKNTPEMLLECLSAPHTTIGAWYEGRLAAISVLYYPHDDAEDLSLYLENVDTKGLKNANYKLCIVSPDFRGNSLQYKLGMLLVDKAKESGVSLICATASPLNEFSIKNIERMGMQYNRTLKKYGMTRNLYYGFI